MGKYELQENQHDDQKEKRFWEKHYEHYDFFQNKLDWYRKTIQFHIDNMDKCISVLDTGAGSGNLTIELAKKGKNVVAIDSEPYSLKLLKNKVKQSSRNIDLAEGNVEKLPFLDNKFDGVTSMFLVPFVDDNEKYFFEVYRVLKSKGVFSASIWAPIQKPEENWNLRDAIADKFVAMGLLPKYQKEWEELLYTSKINAKNIDSKNLNQAELKNILENIGFLDILIESDTAYDGYAYFLTARK